VLEPLQASPTIIEDNCFIGARSEVVEGVIVEAGAVIGMASTSARAPRSTTGATGEILYGSVPCRFRGGSRSAARPPTAAIACTAPSSSSRWMRRPAAKVGLNELLGLTAPGSHRGTWP